MSEDVRVARHAGIVGAATMLSRVLGLVREQVMATLFGAGMAADAFNVAFRIPNLLRDLFAEGAMSSAFLPAFVATRKDEGDEAANAFGRQLLVALALLLGLLCLVGMWAAPTLVGWFAPGFAAIPGKQELTVQLTRVMLPFLPVVAWAAVAMGMLNARGRFGVPALAPAVMNVGMIGGGLALIPVCVTFGAPPILAMAWGVLLGGVAQFAVQLPALYAGGFRLRFEWPRRHPGVRRVARQMIPAAVGLSATQINLLVSTWIASLLVQGSVSWLAYAFRLMQLPIGVFGVALATVSLPALARAAGDGDLPALKDTLSSTLRLVFVLTIPASVWLAVAAGPLVALLYEHGRFLPADTLQTSRALLCYCLGLPAFAATGVLTRAFYALGDTRTAVQASFVAVAANLGLNLLFVGPLRGLGLEHLGLALATSATSVLNVVLLAMALRRRIGAFGAGRIARSAGTAVLASAMAVAPTVGVLAWLGGALPARWTAELGFVAASLVLTAALGWVGLRALRAEELPALGALAGAVRSRLRG